MPRRLAAVVVKPGTPIELRRDKPESREARPSPPRRSRMTPTVVNGEMFGIRGPSTPTLIPPDPFGPQSQTEPKKAQTPPYPASNTPSAPSWPPPPPA